MLYKYISTYYDDDDYSDDDDDYSDDDDNDT
jgi:hypothetical protein